MTFLVNVTTKTQNRWYSIRFSFSYSESRYEVELTIVALRRARQWCTYFVARMHGCSEYIFLELLAMCACYSAAG